MNRSTKGASKQRRDLINAEILYLRDILPLPETARSRLSQLQVMSLACVYIRKSNYFERLFGSSGFDVETFLTDLDFSQCLSGFLLIATRDGKLLYISGNVTDFLGHSMVDLLTQGDSIYDIIDKQDHSVVQRELLRMSYDSSDDRDQRSFFCRINMSKNAKRHSFAAQKVMHVRGRYIHPSQRDQYGDQPVFLAVCTPLLTPETKENILLNNPKIYRSTHKLDMTFINMDSRGEMHLGLKPADIYGRSWYSLIHPQDLSDASHNHSQVLHSVHTMGSMMAVRMLSETNGYVWVNCVMHLCHLYPTECDPEEAVIECINQVIDEEDVPYYKMQCSLYTANMARHSEFFPQSFQLPSPTPTTYPYEGYQHEQSPCQQHPGFSTDYTGQYAVYESSRDKSYGNPESSSYPSQSQPINLSLSSSFSRWCKTDFKDNYRDLARSKRVRRDNFCSDLFYDELLLEASQLDIPPVDCGPVATLQTPMPSFSSTISRMKLNIKQEAAIPFNGPPTPETPSIKQKSNFILPLQAPIPENIMSPQSNESSMPEGSPGMITPVASPLVSSESDSCEAGSPQCLNKRLPIIDIEILDRFFASFERNYAFEHAVKSEEACRLSPCQQSVVRTLRAESEFLGSITPMPLSASCNTGTSVTGEFTFVDVSSNIPSLMDESLQIEEDDCEQIFMQGTNNSSQGSMSTLSVSTQKL